MYPIVYLNGAYVAKADANLNVADLAILRGYGVFDYFRYADGQPRFLKDHTDRFFRSAASLGLQPTVDKAELQEIVRQLIDRNDSPTGGIRFVLTGGYSPDGYRPGTPNLIGMAYPFTEPAPELYERGVSVRLHDYERQLPGTKTIDYIEGIRVQEQLAREGTDYVLFVNRNDQVLESDRSNFMIVRDGTLITPADDILLGITRHHLLRLAKQLNIPIMEQPVSRAELLSADEAIICSSTKGAMPITRIDGQPVADGTPGPVTRQLMNAWPAYCATV